MLGKIIYKPLDTQKKLNEYSELAEWCNKNNATIEDKGDYYKCVALPMPTDEELLAQAKATKIAELKYARDTEELSPISYGGFLWDFDEKAQMRINGAITVLGSNSITWTSANNEEIRNVTADDLLGVISASATRSNELHIKYRVLRERVEQAITEQEVNAISW